jgi:hypothetical protein
MYSIPQIMLRQVDGVHLRVSCSACTSTAEVCCHRDALLAARKRAVEKFVHAGWHLDAGARSFRAQKAAEADGVGRWFCPTCARQKHM